MSHLKTENLTYVYGEGTPFKITALDNVNIDLEKGEFVAIIGHTGSGKSTLVQHLNGLLKPTNGKIFLDDKDIHSSKSSLYDARFRVGLCFQYPEYQLFEETVYKDIAFGPTNMGLSKTEIDERVRNAAKYVGIPDEMLLKSPFDLSGGETRYTTFNAKIQESSHVFVADYVPLDKRIEAETARAIIAGKKYDITLIDNPMELNAQLEIHLKYTGGV